MNEFTRRDFLNTAAGVCGMSLLGALPSVSKADATPDPKLVRLDSGIEPLVRLLEDTPRERLLEEVGVRIRGGLNYRDVLTALLLAGVRNIQPRPNVGFKFHAVLVVNSAHLASLAAPDSERWLPLFWALDNFKGAQATNIKEGGWRMSPVDEDKVPKAGKAAGEFTEAMTNWDVSRADAAAAAVARTMTPQQAFELFVGFGARDFRDIGHKAIFVANSFRTLQTIGWPHAEPVLRSLAYAILKHEGDNPAKRDGDPDRPGRKNLERVQQLRADWADGEISREATLELLDALRTGDADDVPAKIVKMLNDGKVSPRTIWDALFMGAGELLQRQAGIVALHAVTSMNAFHYAFDATDRDSTRRWLLLQASSFVSLFREALVSRGKLADAKMFAFVPSKVHGAEEVTAIFAEISKDRHQAAQHAFTYLRLGGDPQLLTDAARRFVFFKGTDSHDYKFSAAILEDWMRVSPLWRNHFLAQGMMLFHGSGDRDTPLVERTRAALKT